MATAPSSSNVTSTQPSFDDVITDIAGNVHHSKYHTLGTKLGFSWIHVDNILQTNNQNVMLSATAVLIEWTTKYGSGPVQRQELQRILESAGLGSLAAKLTTIESDLTYQSPDDLLITKGFTVGECRQMLAYRYNKGICKVKIHPWDKKSQPVNVNQIYTVVSMYKKEASETNLGRQEKIVLDGSVDDIFRVKVNGELPNRISIYAGAGKGKTTAVGKMAYDWANGGQGSPLKKVPLLFIIRFRYMTKDQSLGQAIISELLSDAKVLTPKLLEDFIHGNQHLCWIIFDGYDEYSGSLSNVDRKSQSNIISILENKYLVQCRVVVTSRPHLVTDFERNDLQNVYAKMEIEGFSTAYAHLYIDRFFINLSSKGQDLKKYLKQHDIISELIFTPLFCVMVCYLWRDDRMPVISTVTKLFEEIVSFLWHHLRGKCDEKYTERRFLETTRQLGKVAITGLVDDSKKLLFTVTDFAEHPATLSNGLELGLISESENSTVTQTRSERKIEFFHKSAQEYLAGKYLANDYHATGWMKRTLHLSGIERMIRQKRKCLGDYENVIRFAAGTDTNMCVLLMNKILKTTYLDKGERFRIILDLSTEAHDLGGDVKGLLVKYATQDAVILKSPTLYTVVGMKKLPDEFKLMIKSLEIKAPALTSALSTRLSDGIQSLPNLEHVTITEPTKVESIPQLSTIRSLKLVDLPFDCDCRHLRSARCLESIEVSRQFTCHGDEISIHKNTSSINTNLLENLPSHVLNKVTCLTISALRLTSNLASTLTDGIRFLPNLYHVTIAEPTKVESIPQLPTIRFVRLIGLPLDCDCRQLQSARCLESIEVSWQFDYYDHTISIHNTSSINTQVLKNLPANVLDKINVISILSSSLDKDVCARLWSCLASFSSLTRLYIRFSYLLLPARPPPIPSVQRLKAHHLLPSESYSGLIGSLSGLKEIVVGLEHAERDITQIAAGLERSGGEGVTYIQLEGEGADDLTVSAACMSGLVTALRRTNRLQKIELLKLNIDAESLVRLVNQCRFISTMTKIIIECDVIDSDRLHSHMRDLHRPKGTTCIQRAIEVGVYWELQKTYRIIHAERLDTYMYNGSRATHL